MSDKVTGDQRAAIDAILDEAQALVAQGYRVTITLPLPGEPWKIHWKAAIPAK